MKYKFIQNLLLIFFTITSLNVDARTPTSRDPNYSENLSPCANVNGIATITLLSKIADKLCGILDIQKYESTYKGGICICNLRGPNHDTPNTHCWDYPLLISNSNPTFDGINIVKIKENIVFKPNANATCPVTNQQAAIIIDKDDMTIDLQGFTITMDPQNLDPQPPTPCPVETSGGSCQADPGCIPAVHGIHILPGVKNTRIISTQSENTQTRGSIKKFSGYGIYMEGSLTIDPIKGSLFIEEVYLNNIRVYGCANGIYAQYASNINITHSEANNNCNFNTVYGMNFLGVSNLYIVGSQASSNRSCNSVYGIYMKDTCNSFIQDTETSKNSSFYIGEIGTEGNAYGMYLTGMDESISYANVIKDCKSSSNQCGGISINNNTECAGIFLTSGTAHNIIENCTVISNTFLKIGDGLGGFIINAPEDDPHVYGIRLNMSNFNELNKNKVGFNASVAQSGTENPGISDALEDGSTSLFTANISYFNGYQGDQNYDVLFRKNKTKTEEMDVTIIYAANLDGFSTKTPIVANIDGRKAPKPST